MGDLRTVVSGGNTTLIPADEENEITEKIGYMVKKSRNRTGRLTNWRKRYFVLTRTCLKYYKDEEEAKNVKAPRGYVYLQQRTKVNESSERSHCFVIKSPGQKPMSVQCTDEAELFEWVKRLRELSADAAPRPIKLVLVGDEGDGKEDLLREFFLECNQEDLVRKIKWEDNITLNLEVTGERVKVSFSLVDSRGLASLRTLNYIGANAFMMCFSSCNKRTFDSIESTWHKEIQNDSVPSFLVGIQTKKHAMIERNKAEALSEYLGTEGYFDVRLKKHGGKPKLSVNEDHEEEDAFVTTAAETFLTVLESTLDYMEEIESTNSKDDVANLDDFRREGFAFVDAVKRQVLAFRKFMAQKQSNIRLFSSTDGFESEKGLLTNTNKFDEEDDEFIKSDDAKKESGGSFSSFGAIQTLRKYFATRVKKTRPKKRPLSAAETSTADFVNRQHTGSLVFLGLNSDFSDEDEDDNDETGEKKGSSSVPEPSLLLPQRLGG